MTVIAWDGKTLAGDKLMSFGGLHATATKVHRVGNKLVGGCGTSAVIQEMKHWIGNGADPAKFPASQRDVKENASILVVNADGTLHQYEHTPFPLVLENRMWAIGSGRDFAMMAMHLGRTASEAVLLTNLLCHDCGNGVDTLELLA